MPDYIPAGDTQFTAFLNAFQSYANANLANLGIALPDLAAVNAAQTAWNAAYGAHATAQNAAQSAREAKDLAKANAIAAVRALVGILQQSPNVSDAERQGLGITVPDTEPTPVGPPETRPVLQADTSQRLRVTISFADEGTPTQKAKPAGVVGVELYVKIGGPAPTDIDDCEFLAFDTRTPYVADFDGAQANQTAHFIGRWMSTRSEAGPISETVSATIPG